LWACPPEEKIESLIRGPPCLVSVPKNFVGEIAYSDGKYSYGESPLTHPGFPGYNYPAMKDNQSTCAGEPCLAMRKRFKVTSFMIVGATALFVGLAGTVGAVSFSTQNDLNAATRSGSLGRDLSQYQAAYSPGPGNFQSFASPTPFSLSGSARAENVGVSRSTDSWQFNLRRRIYGLSTPSPRAQTPIVAPAGIPDGGSTALMLGGVLCGLALAVRKPKA
jgi:hypothetical protein